MTAPLLAHTVKQNYLPIGCAGEEAMAMHFRMIFLEIGEGNTSRIIKPSSGKSA